MTSRVSALVLLAALHAAGAQSTREIGLDGGVALVQQTGRTGRDGASILGGSWREISPLFATALTATVTSAGDSVSAAQAALAAAWRASERTPWQTEAGMVAAAFGSSLLARGGSFSGFARERLSLDWGGVWAGGAFGGTSRDNIPSHSSSLDLGAWMRQGDFEFTASATRMRSDDDALLEAEGIFFVSPDASWYYLTDATADVRFEHGPVVIDASGTWRSGGAGVTTAIAQAAYYASATWTFSPRFALAVGTGRQLADPVRGVPDVQITSVVLHVSIVPARAGEAPAVSRASSYATVTPKSSGALMVVRVIADDSSRVEVAGTFSDWKPVPLTRTAEGWEAEIALPPGRHRVAVRFNGGPWKAPAGTAHIRDEFGGEAGLVVVP
jgi:hypothetical protein